MLRLYGRLKCKLGQVGPAVEGGKVFVIDYFQSCVKVEASVEDDIRIGGMIAAAVAVEELLVCKLGICSGSPPES